MASNTDAQIRSMIAQIGQLEQRIDEWRRAMDAASRKKRQYEERLREVQNVERELSRLDGRANAVRQRQNEMGRNVERATAGLAHESDIVASLTRDFERNTGDDPIGREMHSYLQREIARCRSEIESAQHEVNSASSSTNSLCSQRTGLVQKAHAAAKSPDATVHVTESLRY